MAAFPCRQRPASASPSMKKRSSAIARNRQHMKIESVDFFYLSMPVVTDAGDGSQDALVVRVRAGGIDAWGECEASPLTSIASYICPMSHGACRPISASVLGEDVSSPGDI